MTTRVRKPCVAGGFYPADPVELNAILDKMIAAAGENAVAGRDFIDASPAGVIVPHAGYVYSGVIAAAGLTAAAKQRKETKRIVLVAPSHRFAFNGVAVGDYTELDTPIGKLPVDLERQNALAAAADGVLLHHAERPLETEHALEVELPLIRRIFGEIPVLPAVAGHLFPDDAKKLAACFSGFSDADTLFVVSSDFTHYGRDFDYVPFTGDVRKKLRELDLSAAEVISGGDPAAFGRFLAATGATICGAAPIKLALAALGGAGKVYGGTVAYTNSGELTGDFSHCVGYCAVTLYKK